MSDYRCANCGEPIKNEYGDENHHIVESVFKAFARAMRMAVELDPRDTGLPSSKGVL